jgi:hypothetical protein
MSNIDEKAYQKALKTSPDPCSSRTLIEAYEAAKAVGYNLSPTEQPDEFILNQIISEIDDAGQGQISPDRLREAANFCMSFIKRESVEPDSQEFLRNIVDVAWQNCTESASVPSTSWADLIIAEARRQTRKTLE